jgi:hypothetical protein
MASAASPASVRSPKRSVGPVADASGALCRSPARYVVCFMTMPERYGAGPVRDDPRRDDPSTARIIPGSQAASTAT